MFSFFKKKAYRSVTVSGSCHSCGKCCQNLILLYRGKPITNIKQLHKLAKKEPYYHYFKPVFKDPKDGTLTFACSKLNDDNTCRIYDRRPQICRDYPDPLMFRHGGKLLPGCGYTLNRINSFENILAKRCQSTLDN